MPRSGAVRGYSNPTTATAPRVQLIAHRVAAAAELATEKDEGPCRRRAAAGRERRIARGTAEGWKINKSGRDEDMQKDPLERTALSAADEMTREEGEEGGTPRLHIYIHVANAMCILITCIYIYIYTYTILVLTGRRRCN